MQPIRIRSKKFPIPFRGPDNPAEMKGFIDNAIADLIFLAENVTRLQGELAYSNTILQTNEEYIRDLAVHAKSQDSQKLMFNIDAGYPIAGQIDYFINLYSSDTIDFEGIEQHHGYYDQSLGKAYPPRNGVANFFYIRDALQDYRTISREPIVTFSVEPVITPGEVFFKESDFNNMFNGDNHLYWVREYSYALHSDISSVTLEFTIDVPAGLGVDPNFIVLDPYPGLGMTINEIVTDSGTIVGTPIVNATRLAYEVPAGTTTVTINMIQRAFKVHEGRKLFALGFREIDLQFVTWDATATDITPDTADDSHIVLELPLESTFSTIEEIQLDADVNRIIVKGYLIGAEDANVYDISRTSFNNFQLLSPAFAFSGNVDTLRIYAFLNADPADNANRNNRKIDYMHAVSIRMS